MRAMCFKRSLHLLYSYRLDYNRDSNSTVNKIFSLKQKTINNPFVISSVVFAEGVV